MAPEEQKCSLLRHKLLIELDGFLLELKLQYYADAFYLPKSMNLTLNQLSIYTRIPFRLQQATQWN